MLGFVKVLYLRKICKLKRHLMTGIFGIIGKVPRMVDFRLLQYQLLIEFESICGLTINFYFLHIMILEGGQKKTI